MRIPDDVISHVSTAEANRMAYKDMNYCLYLGVTFGLFGVELVIAFILNDITTVFDFLSAFVVTCLAFWFPGGYYLMAENRYAKTKNTTMRVASYIFMFLGAVNCLIGIAAAVLNII